MNETAAAPQPEAVPDTWARVEIFGHRRHYGRITEVEKFGTKMLRIDVPGEKPDEFESHFYGGGSIFGITIVTEEAARKWAAYERPRPVEPMRALPPADRFDDDEAFDEPEDDHDAARRCRECGCTDDHACMGDDGAPCYWVEPDLCSVCAAREDKRNQREQEAAGEALAVAEANAAEAGDPDAPGA